MRSLAKEIKILAVIPTFNNQESIKDVISSVLQTKFDLLVVNDGSTDSTKELLVTFGSSIRIVSHQRCLGKGAALLTGFNYAIEHGFSHIISMDADGQHLAEDLNLFKSAIYLNPNKIIIGDRKLHRANQKNIPMSSKFGCKFSNFWVWIETGRIINDTQSGFRAYPVKNIPLERLNKSHYDFEIEILVKSMWQRIEVESIEITVFYPPKTERISHFRPFKDNYRLFLLHSRLCFIRVLSILFAKKLGRKIGEKKERKGSFLLNFFLNILGIRASYFFGRFVPFLYFLSGKKARLGILNFYSQLGENSLVLKYAKSYKNYLQFAASMIDRVAFAHGVHLPRVEFQCQFDAKFENGFVGIGAHYGDWTFCGSVLQESFKRDVHIVIDLKSSPGFQKQASYSGTFGLNIIDASAGSHSVILEAKRALDNKNVVCFLSDRGADSSRNGEYLFLGKNARFNRGPFEIAFRLRKPIVSFYCTKKEYSHLSPYVLHWEILWDGLENATVDDIILKYVGGLEKIVRTQPENWFNFFDFWCDKNVIENLDY